MSESTSGSSRAATIAVTGGPAGDIRIAEPVRALDADASGAVTVLDAGSRDLVVAYPDELLHDASAKILRNNIGRLPVVDRKDPRTRLTPGSG